MKTEEDILEFYKEEIKSGEVKKEDILSFDKLLKLDFVEDRNEIERLLTKTASLFWYFQTEVFIPCNSFIATYLFEVRGINDKEEMTNNCRTFKNLLSTLFYTNAFKRINL